MILYMYPSLWLYLTMLSCGRRGRAGIDSNVQIGLTNVVSAALQLAV